MLYHRLYNWAQRTWCRKKKTKTKKLNSQISADLAVGRKILSTYIKLICLRSPWQTVIHIAVPVMPTNKKALQKVARQTVGAIHLTLDKKNKEAKLKNLKDRKLILELNANTEH